VHALALCSAEATNAPRRFSSRPPRPFQSLVPTVLISRQDAELRPSTLAAQSVLLEAPLTSGARTVRVRIPGDLCSLVIAGVLATALSAEAGSRVIVSTTLDSTLEMFDADSLAELQPPLPSRGGGPVRLWVQRFDGKEYLLAANHGALLGSVGVFDLSGEQVMELPLSPFPARAGSVGIAAGELAVGATQVPVVLVTNTQSAVAAVAGFGCSLPNGSVTAYDASGLSTLGILQEIGTVDVSAPVPYAVSVDPAGAHAFASTNCGDALDTLTVTASGGSSLALSRTATRSTGASPDGTIYDGARGLNYTANIGGNSLSVHDAQSLDALLTVDLPGAGPIDVTLADSPGGHHWVITSNGSDDSVSLIDRDRIAECIYGVPPTCLAPEMLRVPTAVAGGAPEGVAYDAATNRIFAVNKFPLGSPSLSVIQITEPADGPPSGVDIGEIPLTALGVGTPLPAFIAFDVVVQAR